MPIRQINKTDLLLTLALGLILSTAHAETVIKRSHKSKLTTTTETTEMSDPSGGGVGETLTTSTTNEISESEISTVFGSQAMSGLGGCKTEELSRPVLKGLRSDCQAWIKDQHSDLGKRFLTSACEDSCTDCGMSLQRCTVTGTVRYHKGSTP